MQILGVDYGRRKIGLAMASGPLAEPHKVIRFASKDEAIKKVGKVVKVEQVEKVVVGVSEGEMGEETKAFGRQLSVELSIPVETFDETLSTQEGQRLSIEAGIKRNRRRKLEDAFAATVMLQSYIDNKR